MAQPLDRLHRMPVLGELDVEAGEFWVENPFLLKQGRANLSAYERNQMYLNTDGRSFVNVSYHSRADLDSDSRAALWADFNRDGAPDLLVESVGGGPLRLFYNRFPTENHRVRIRLRGAGANSAGIGTRIIAYCGGRRIVRDLFPQNGFRGIGPAELCLGTGPAERIDRLTLRWPDGQTQELQNVPADCHLTITQGQSEFEESPFSKP